MTAVELRTDISTLVDAVASGDNQRILATAREYLERGENPEVLLGRVGLVAARGDADGHVVTTLGSAAMLCRLLHTIPQPVEGEILMHERALPLFVQPLLFASLAVRIGEPLQIQLPEPLYPSSLIASNKTVNEMMRQAIDTNDVTLTERLLLGLYGTGADYRTMQIRTYDGIATTFQNAGHPLMFAVRGFQLLDALEWGDRAPAILHWLAPHLPLRLDTQEPEWVKSVRAYTANPAHEVSSVRTRLAAPKNENALPLRTLVMGDADTTQVCQGVYDALMTGGASPTGIASVLALTAADVMTRVDDSNRELFVRVAHGLLFAAATRLVLQKIQDVEALPMLFTSAAYVNVLNKEVTGMNTPPSQTPGTTAGSILGGGLIAPSQLETLNEQLKAQDYAGALNTARRYLKLGHDTRALFAMIALAAARNDASIDQGHTLQIVQAASEEFQAWPATLAEVDIEPLLRVAIRAAAFGQRSPITEAL